MSNGIPPTIRARIRETKLFYIDLLTVGPSWSLNSNFTFFSPGTSRKEDLADSESLIVVIPFHRGKIPEDLGRKKFAQNIY